MTAVTTTMAATVTTMMTVVWVLIIVTSSLVFLRNFFHLHFRGPSDERPVFKYYLAVCSFTTFLQLGLLFGWSPMRFEAVPLGFIRLAVTLEVIRLLNFGELSERIRGKLWGWCICLGVTVASLVAMMNPASYPGLPVWVYHIRLYLDIGMIVAVVIGAIEARLTHNPDAVSLAFPHAASWMAFLFVNIYGMLDRPKSLDEWQAFDAAAKIVQAGCITHSVNLVELVSKKSRENKNKKKKTKAVAA